MVEVPTSGFSVARVEHKMGLRGSPTAELVFDGVRLSSANLIGAEGDGFDLAIRIGEWATKLGAPVMHRFRTGQEFDGVAVVLKFRSDTVDLVRRRWGAITAAQLGVSFTQFLIFFAALRGVEGASTETSILVAFGAFAAGLLDLAVPTSPIWAQAVLAVVVALLGVVIGRPFLSQRLKRRGEPPLTPGVHGGFVGQRALALDEVGDELHPGHVRLAGETWLAFAEDHQSIPTGAPVIVTAVRGTTLAVRPADGPTAPEA